MKRLPTDENELSIVGMQIALELSLWYDAKVKEMAALYPGETRKDIEHVVVSPCLGYLTGMFLRAGCPREKLLEFVRAAGAN